MRCARAHGRGDEVVPSTHETSRIFQNEVVVSLATAAAAACLAGATPTTPLMPVPAFLPAAGSFLPAAEAGAGRRRIYIVSGINGNKRRYYRRPSRRSTLALASELPPPSEDQSTAAVAGSSANDPTREADLVALPEESESHEIDERDDEYEHQVLSAADSSNNGGTYQRILPARRRVVRRFTMPSKGRSFSPLSKKPRTVGRSLSCRSPEDALTPAA